MRRRTSSQASKAVNQPEPGAGAAAGSATTIGNRSDSGMLRVRWTWWRATSWAGTGAPFASVTSRSRHRDGARSAVSSTAPCQSWLVGLIAVVRRPPAGKLVVSTRAARRAADSAATWRAISMAASKRAGMARWTSSRLQPPMESCAWFCRRQDQARRTKAALEGAPYRRASAASGCAQVVSSRSAAALRSSDSRHPAPAGRAGGRAGAPSAGGTPGRSRTTRDPSGCAGRRGRCAPRG